MYKYTVHYSADDPSRGESIEDRSTEGLMEVFTDERVDYDNPDHWLDIARSIGQSGGFSAVQVLKISSPPEIIDGELECL